MGHVMWVWGRLIGILRELQQKGNANTVRNVVGAAVNVNNRV